MPRPRKLPHFPPAIIEDIIKLAWADAMPFELIQIEYGLTENQVRALMRAHQSEKTYIRWRTRVETRREAKSKHGRISTKTSTRLKYN